MSPSPLDRQRRPELLRLLELLSPTDRRVIAHLWESPGVEASALAGVMTDPQRVARQWQRLSDLERAALTRVLQENGSVPVAIMQREWGSVREPGGFEHPRAYLQALQSPATPTERLFSMGLIVRGNDERGAIYRIPNDLRALLPEPPPRDRALHVTTSAAESGDPAGTLPADELALRLLTLAYQSDLKTLADGALNKASLVLLARSWSPDEMERVRGARREADWPLAAIVRSAAVEAGLLRRTGDGLLRPTPQAIDWLRATRAERMRRLLDGWYAAPIDDLALLCGLRWKGGAPYTLNRSATRRALLRLIGTLPAQGWIDAHEIVAEIRRVEPDFQRRDGRYDTWLLYDRAERLVSGWPDWNRVEGELIRQTLAGPLRWLGIVDQDATGERVRITSLGAHLLMDAPAPDDPPAPPLLIQSTFEVLCPPGVSPYARFQLMRIAERERDGTVAVYRLTRRALLHAIERGVEVADVLRFLQEQAAGPLPPAVAYTIREWGGQAEQVRLASAVLLETDDPVVMAQLRNTRRSAGIDGELIAPTVLRLPEGSADEIAERLRQAGFGVRDSRIDPQRPLDERDLRALVTAALVYTRICGELGLPCDISTAMLQRIARLVPPRVVAEAEAAAAQAVQRLQNQADETA